MLDVSLKLLEIKNRYGTNVSHLADCSNRCCCGLIRDLSLLPYPYPQLLHKDFSAEYIKTFTDIKYQDPSDEEKVAMDVVLETILGSDFKKRKEEYFKSCKEKIKELFET